MYSDISDHRGRDLESMEAGVNRGTTQPSRKCADTCKDGVFGDSAAQQRVQTKASFRDT